MTDAPHTNLFTLRANWRAFALMLTALARRAVATKRGVCTLEQALQVSLACLTIQLRAVDARKDDLSTEEFSTFAHMLAISASLLMILILLQNVKERATSAGRPEPRDARCADLPVIGGHRYTLPALQLMPCGYFDSS